MVPEAQIGSCLQRRCRLQVIAWQTAPAKAGRPKRTSCTAVAALAAIVLANLSVVSRAFSSPWVGTRTAARSGRDAVGSSIRSSVFAVPAARPRASRRQRQLQQHEAARSSVPQQCARLGGVGTSTSISTRSSPRQLSTRRAASPTSTAMMGSSNANTAKDQQQQQQLQLVPGTVLLQPGDPIEFWHAQGLVLGNYESPVRGRQSLVVRTDTGEQLTIDAGQIIGVWREDEMSGRLPRSGSSVDGGGSGGGGNNGGTATVAAWAEIREEARALLQSTPARGLDLGPFWRTASSKGKGLVVTPAHAAEFLFGVGSPAKLGLRKRPPFQFRG